MTSGTKKYLDAVIYILTSIVALHLVVSPTRGESPLAKLIISAFDQDATWQRIQTNDEEFSILMPIRPPVFVKGNQNLGANRVRVSMERVVKGYQDGFVFIVKMYETSNPKGLLNDYFDISHYSKANKREINISGLKGVEYLRKEDALYHNIQCFATKRRVYVIEVAGRSEANPAINKFLSSLRLGAAASGPNSAFSVVGNSSGQNSTTLASTPVTNRAFDKSEVTHQAVALYLPIPVRPNGFRGAVKLKMVLSATGEVTDISVAKGPNPSFSQYLTDLARFIIFLPAEKDGLPVSQSSEVTFNFQ